VSSIVLQTYIIVVMNSTTDVHITYTSCLAIHFSCLQKQQKMVST